MQRCPFILILAVYNEPSFFHPALYLHQITLLCGSVARVPLSVHLPLLLQPRQTRTPDFMAHPLFVFPLADKTPIIHFGAIYLTIRLTRERSGCRKMSQREKKKGKLKDDAPVAKEEKKHSTRKKQEKAAPESNGSGKKHEHKKKKKETKGKEKDLYTPKETPDASIVPSPPPVTEGADAQAILFDRQKVFRCRIFSVFFFLWLISVQPSGSDVGVARGPHSFP